MEEEDQNCKHQRIERNCYYCYLNRNGNEPVNFQDMIFTTLSELKIRISKLEEYRRLQDDVNREYYKHIIKYDEHIEMNFNKLSDESEERMKEIEVQQRHDMARITHHNEWLLEHDDYKKKLFSHDDKINILLLKLNKLETAFKESQVYVPFDEDDYADESEPPVILNMVDSNSNDVRFVGNITVPKETLCMDKFTKPKTTGLTFEEAITAFKAGKKIKRKEWAKFFYLQRNEIDDSSINSTDMLAEDWEIVNEP